uniref:Uncharacterized protein n=1 Tax=Acrobeloides nanus TaxID=290746 RepID=A0A914E587_9BILA
MIRIAQHIDPETWSKKAWAVIILESVIIGALAGYHIQLAEENNIIWPYNLGLISIFLLIAICNLTSYVDNHIASNKSHNYGQVYIHLHHWQMFYSMAFFTRFIDPISQFSSGVFIAIFIQGGCQYGFDDILEINEIKELHIVTGEEKNLKENLILP